MVRDGAASRHPAHHAHRLLSGAGMALYVPHLARLRVEVAKSSSEREGGVRRQSAKKQGGVSSPRRWYQSRWRGVVRGGGEVARKEAGRSAAKAAARKAWRGGVAGARSREQRT